MPATVIDGTRVADSILAETRCRAAAFERRSGRPGGVGPSTIAVLLSQTVAAAERP